jgi:hypothetical protein
VTRREIEHVLVGAAARSGVFVFFVKTSRQP